jgi:hypothetical protein
MIMSLRSAKRDLVSKKKKKRKKKNNEKVLCVTFINTKSNGVQKFRNS